MQVRILGTRGKIPQSAPKHSNYSGILIDQKILVDVGESQYMDHNPEAILFTHYHPDHAFFVFDQQEFDPDLPVFGPEKHELIPRVQVRSETYQLGPYTVTPFPVIHALHLRSLGYLIEKGTKKLIITGDVAWVEKNTLQHLPRVGLIITEASFIRKGGMIRRKDDHIFGHTGIPDLVRILGPLSSQIAFVHYGSWFFKDIKEARQQLLSFENDDLKIIPTFDGMTLEL